MDGGADGGTVGDSGGSGDGGFTPGPHPPYPSIPNNGGTALASPNLVTVTFASDPSAPSWEALGDWMVSSQWFAAWRGDYGVGPATHYAKVRLPGVPPATLDENSTGALLLDAIADGGLPTLPNGSMMIYAVYPPSSTSVSGFGHPGCTQRGNDFIGGYHWEAQRGAEQIAFAVVPTCVTSTITETQGSLEYSATHEFAEACTNPYPYSALAYRMNDASSAWLVVGGEVGDECAGLRGQEASFTYQRIWSNGSAAAGGPECVPGAPGPFFGTSLSPSTQQTVPAGGSVTYTLQAWSLAPVPDWTLVALPYPMGMTPSVTLSSTTMNNGTSATLIVGVPPTAASGSSAVILVYSADAQGNASMWPSVVSVL